MSDKRKKIEFETYQSISDDGPWTVYQFFPDGVWDEWKRTRAEALKAYPIKDYIWIDVTEGAEDHSGNAGTKAAAEQLAERFSASLEILA